MVGDYAIEERRVTHVTAVVGEAGSVGQGGGCRDGEIHDSDLLAAIKQRAHDV